ncbi:MAG: carboxypeptidase-like regulatory domain-containing protein [Bacteroidales bacterium]
MKKFFFPFMLITLVLAFASCQKDKEGDNTDLNFGYVKGNVYTPSGVPVPAASIFIDVEGEIYFARTDKNGYFYLRAPEGERVLNLQGGDGSIFRSQYNVEIKADAVTAFPDNTLKISQAEELAYIPGAFDHIETILIDSLGYTADMLSVADLDNLTLLESYGAIFLNCGKTGNMDSVKYENLEQYVMNGGNIYASDWAVEYLTGDGNFLANSSQPFVMHEHKLTHASNPKSGCLSPEVGGFIDDATLCTDKDGPSTMLYQADIVDTLIQAFLGKTKIDIEYDLGAWEVIKDLTIPWEVLIQDPVTYGPLAVRMNFPTQAATRSQLDQGWVTICHFPPGNPSNMQTITISINALPAHLAHGDYIGSCVGGSGSIFFTTFHNHVQGNIGPDTYQMLQYFIMNL